MMAVPRCAVAVLGCVAAVACSSSGDHPATASSASLSGTPQQRFLELVHTTKFQDAGLSAYSDATLLGTGEGACKTFLQHKPGRSSQAAWSRAINDMLRLNPDKWTVLSAGAVVEAADLTLC